MQKKINPITLVWITTLLLITITIMVAMNLPFNWVFYATVLGQGAVVFMVYGVLTDDYTTNKTFEDFYQDYDVENKQYR